MSDIGEGMVRMHHPDLQGEETAVVTVDAFTGTWRDKGWKVTEDGDPRGLLSPEDSKATDGEPAPASSPAPTDATTTQKPSRRSTGTADQEGGS